LEHLIFKSIAEQILSKSVAVVDDVLDHSILDELSSEALSEYRDGEFTEASIGKGVAKQRVSEVRGDKVFWLSKENTSLALAAYWGFVDGLRTYLSEFFRVHLERTELHFAVYPIGAFYTPHLDQFRDHGNRVFSLVLYLNKDWKKGDGGELRVHNDDASYNDIEPLHGRLVCFRSDQVLHEVLEAKKTRISLTGWIRRDAFTL
jgi:SM-20-related protein